ncbi:Hypothetical predicted protein [Mytilus galloprovincialis]|uniref:LRRNT domain-containing protein n=1 Tax=Mytilus galloprovincialis TaxID=29158 RepID=A0A8B6E6K3_MYTGA|nr:Hypothetical predicted protein [Mytilus galloprovincialis]
MSALLWCKEITLVLFIGVSSNSNEDCERISICRTECMTIGPNYHCYSRGLIEVPSFPESTVLLDLSTNRLTSVPDAVFRNNVALETLDMSDNYLTSVHADVFKNNVELEHLNRVKEINEITQEYTWKYCPTDSNPADMLSRGVTATRFLELDLWMKGPEWLTDKSNWPQWKNKNHTFLALQLSKDNQLVNRNRKSDLMKE